jgi:ubiquinone/menaquinone biosynthesis C-methylase UbiE
MGDTAGTYVLSRSPGETRRLQLQAQFYAPHTNELLRMAGIRPGMRILDAGCGAGDVSMEAARIAEASGSVLGVDADHEILAVARRRVAGAGLSNVSFEQASVPDVPLGAEVDAVIGRLILVHLDDPAAALRAMSRLVVPGGVVAFQDFNVSRARSVPEVPLMTRCVGWICAALRAGGRNPDTGERLISIFRRAALPVPVVKAAIPATTDPAACELAAATVVSLLPMIEKAGVATREEIDPDTLAERLWADVSAADAVIVLPELVGAWARVPDDTDSGLA